MCGIGLLSAIIEKRGRFKKALEAVVRKLGKSVIMFECLGRNLSTGGEVPPCEAGQAHSQPYTIT